MATGEAAGRRDIQPSFFFPLSLLVLPQQQQRHLLRARMLNRRQKSEFFLSDSGLAAPWRGGLWERQGAEALMLCGRWHRSDALPPEPMALLKITAPRLAAVCVCVFDCVVVGFFFFFPPRECLCVCVFALVHVQSCI